MKKLLIFILALLLVIPCVASVPPITTVSTGVNGLELQAPTLPYFKIGSEGYLSMHVFNKSDGVLMKNDTTSCYAILTNVDGSEIFHQDGIPHEDHFEFNFSTTDVTIAGIYGFTLHCNTSISGGFITGYFEANSTGTELTVARAILYVLFIIILFIIFVSSLMAVKLLPTDKRDEEGSLLSISYLKHLKYTLWIFAYFMAIAILFVSANVCLAFLGTGLLCSLLFKLYQIMFGLSPLLIIVMILSFFSRLNTDKQFQSMLNRGMLPGKV